jgi:hypothetical protein
MDIRSGLKSVKSRRIPKGFVFPFSFAVKIDILCISGLRIRRVLSDPSIDIDQILKLNSDWLI